MSGPRYLGVAIAVAGIVFFIVGMNATDAPFERLSETFTGKYTDQTMWYIAGGLAAALGGAILALVPSSR